MKKLQWLLLGVLITGKLLAQDILTDPRDGKKYNTIKIEDKVWMAKNLAYKTTVASSREIPENSNENGYLYDWPTAKKVCPVGWHLPTKAEWQHLIQKAGGLEKAGSNLMSTTSWENNRGKDILKFNAKPAGYWDAFDDEFRGQGKYGNWWTSTVVEVEEGDEEYADKSAWIYSIEFNKDSISCDELYTIFKYSVRCVKDLK